MRKRKSAYAKVVTPLRSLRPPAYLSWSRRVLGRFIQARTGHGHFAEYHDRCGHAEEDGLCHLCGRTCTRLHPLTCRAFAPYRHLLRDERDRKLKPTEALQCPSAFRAYVIASNAYARAS